MKTEYYETKQNQRKKIVEMVANNMSKYQSAHKFVAMPNKNEPNYTQ